MHVCKALRVRARVNYIDQVNFYQTTETFLRFKTPNMLIRLTWSETLISQGVYGIIPAKEP